MPNHKNMPYRKLGQSGLKVSAFGLGGWTTFGGSVSDEILVRKILHTAFDAGVNFFDIADIYAKGESERFMGAALKELPRHELVISSKVFWPMSDDVNDQGLSRKHIMESIEKSLKRIGTDYLDLYFCHRFDPETPLEETVRAMDDLVHQGKILYWGTSEWSGTQLKDVANLCNGKGWYRPLVEQPQYNLLYRERYEQDIAPTCQSLGMGTVVWSPLASGLLTGKYNHGIPSDSRLQRIDWLKDNLYTEDRLAKVRKLTELAKSLQVKETHLALQWAASHPQVSSVILGATTLPQLQDNLAALAVTLTPEIRTELNRLFGS